MSNKKIDLTDIKKNDLDETSSFTDLMTKKERLNRRINSNDIDDMINEKRKKTKDLTNELKKAKEEYNKEFQTKKRKKENTEDTLGKTQILELTRTMKFNFEETKEENINKKNGITFLNIIGVLNLLCIGFYIYLLTFTNYQDSQNNYLITGSLIVLLVLLFGISVVSNKIFRKVFNLLNLLIIITFIIFNIYILMH